MQCLKTPSEAINPQSQADMVTRVFWIAVSLLESDYEHEFLMAIHLLNKVSLLEKRGNARTTKLSALLVQNSTEYVLEIDSSSQTILINETSFVNVPVWLDSPLLLPPSPSPPPLAYVARLLSLIRREGCYSTIFARRMLVLMKRSVSLVLCKTFRRGVKAKVFSSTLKLNGV